jgi:MoaA/NifB/PqqE/SkfB family radical SAM enzyme
MQKRRSIGKVWKLATTGIGGIIAKETNYHRMKPTHALLFLTYRCTSRCKMCTMWQRLRAQRPEDELTLHEWKGVVDELCEMGVSIVEFFGGDALLRKDVLIPLIRHAHDRGLFTELPTNCNLLSKDVARALARAGLDHVWVSLDGVGETHDGVRGREGTFERVDRAIADLKRVRGKQGTPKILVNCVITKLNLDNVEEIVSYCRRVDIDAVDIEYVGEIPEASIRDSRLNGITPTPFFTACESSVLLDRREALRLKETLKKIRRNDVSGGPRINTEKIDMLSVDAMAAGRFPNRRCYICRDIVTIDPYGHVMGCLHFNNYHLGDVRSRKLLSIWKGPEHRDFIRFQRAGRIAMCRFCSNGMGRNYDPFQTIQSLYYEIGKRAKS